MRITIGIPTFNRPAYLKESLSSVLAQTYTDFRVIVSDNASKDDTAEVVRAFDDDRIEYVRSASNIGPTNNFNRLIELAETEFLVLLPDDDLLYPDHLAAVVDVLECYPSVGLAHSAFDVIDDRSQVVRTMSPLASDAPVTIEPSKQVLERMMVADWPIGFSTVAYRTRAIADAAGIRPEQEPFGDLQLWMRIAAKWDFGYVARSLSGFRIHAESVTTSIGAGQGMGTEGRERDLLHAQVRFERRTGFLAETPLEPSMTRRLRALATLQLLARRDSWGMTWREMTEENLVRQAPEVALRPAFWHLVLAHLGARRLLAILRRIRARLG